MGRSGSWPLSERCDEMVEDIKTSLANPGHPPPTLSELSQAGSDQTIAILLAIGRIEGKQDLILTLMANQDQDIRRVGTRVALVEKKLNYGAGVAATVAFLWYTLGDAIRIKLGF